MQGHNITPSRTFSLLTASFKLIRILYELPGTSITSIPHVNFVGYTRCEHSRPRLWNLQKLARYRLYSYLHSSPICICRCVLACEIVDSHQPQHYHTYTNDCENCVNNSVVYIVKFNIYSKNRKFSLGSVENPE